MNAAAPAMIPFVREFAFEYGRSEQVSPLIRRVVANNPGPFTFTGTGTYVVGRGEVAVIDPGPALPAHLDALLAAVKGERVTHVLVTHTHADHSPLSRALAAATGAKIYAARPPATPHVPHGADPAALDEDDDAAFAPDVLLTDHEVFEGPGWTLRTVATPGHASNHLAFALDEERALFSGDHVMGWSTTVVAPPDGDMGAYYDSLRRTIEGDYAALWPTHGPPVREVAPVLAAYLAHRRARERQILDRLAAGDRRIAEMIPHVYAAVDRRLWPAAAQSMLAHLLHLAREGVISADGPPGPGAAWRLT